MLLPVPCPTCGTVLDDCRPAHGSTSVDEGHEHEFLIRIRDAVFPLLTEPCILCGTPFGLAGTAAQQPGRFYRLSMHDYARPLIAS